MHPHPSFDRKATLSVLGAMNLCLAIWLVPAVGHAAVITSISDDPPSSEISLITIAETATTGNAQWRNNGTANTARRDIGQTFLIPTTSEGFSLVTGFTFRISDVTGGIGANAGGAAFSLSIYSFSDASDYTPNGAALHTSTGTLPTTLIGQDYLTFSLDTELSLTSNQYYGVMLTFPTWVANQSLNFVTAGSAAYSDGRGVFYQWSESDASYTYQPSNGNFQLYVVTVPEPQSILLLMLAGMALVWNHRRLSRVGMVGAATVMALSPLASTQAASEKPTILLIGDSTVLNYPAESPIQGWGNFLPKYLNPDWQVVNLARGGASSKTYLTFPQWDEAQKVTSDYVFIQFGHNDAHGPGRPESTDAATDFRTYLKDYIAWARNKGSKPILVTPMHRRTFAKNGMLSDVLLPYADAVKEVAAEEQVPVIDLHTVSGEWFLSLGETGSADLTGPNNDLSHFSPKGADWLALKVAQQAREVDPTLSAAFLAQTQQP